MAEIETIRQAAQDAPAQGTNPAGQDIATAQPPDLEHTKIKSNFTQSPSTYWALAIPLLSARYTAEAANNFFKPRRKYLAKMRNELEETAEKMELKDTAWAWGVGGGMVAVTSFYTVSTYGDMKRQFKESLAWEFDKDPDKVGFIDMMKSKNVLIHDAAKNLVSRSAKRLAAHLPFFAFLAPSPFRVNGEKVAMDAWVKGSNPIKLGDTSYTKFLGPKDSVNFGVGTNAIYLASDALGRKRTFFEELQRLIDVKINHKDTLGQIVTAQDLINLYDRQARNDGAEMPKMNSQQWQNDVRLFEHMADLMNQTYENTPRTGYADFTIPKLIYMMGMGLLKSDDPEKSQAYIEVANRYGIPAVKKVAADVQSGVSLETAMAPFPIALEACGKGPASEAAAQPAPEAPVKSFANESLKRTRPEASFGSHAEKAARSAGSVAGMSV